MKKSKQIAGGFLIILSFFVSSVAACVCSHHAEKVESESPSCHEHSEPKPSAGESENPERLDANDECLCVQSAPRAFSKSETLKIEKQAAISPSPAALEIKALSIVSALEKVYFEKPFDLSDSCCNLKSPRAPPVCVKRKS
jgi:hypothetical protein